MTVDFRASFALQVVAAATVAGSILVLAGADTLAGRIGLLAGIAFALISRPPLLIHLPLKRTRRRAHYALIALIATTAAAILILAHFGTTEPTRSPWSVLPSSFYAIIGLAAAATIILAFRNEAIARSGVGIVLAIGSLVGVLIYRLGFGFDHFIHVAAERLIMEHGGLSPLPIFYSGYYGLTTLLATVPGISVDLADRLIAPMIAAVFLPALLFNALNALRISNRAALLATLSLLIVPSLPFIVSTPQALSNIFTLATLLLIIQNTSSCAIAPPSWKQWTPPFLTALAALVSQPMSGIIAFSIVAVALCTMRGWRIGAIFAGIAGALAIPTAFAIAPFVAPEINIRIALAIEPTMARISGAVRDALTFTAQDFATADALAIARVVLPLVWVALAIVGYRILRRTKLAPLRIVIAAAPLIALLAAIAVAATITTPTQLPTEQSQFPLRLLQLAALLATPLVGLALGTLFDRIRDTTKRNAVTMVFSAAIVFTLLIAYPRDDAQARSGLWSVSASDVAAVHAIMDDAITRTCDGVPAMACNRLPQFVVLANQMLGAAAIQEFGFRPSSVLSDGREILAFPLPAGGPVAQQFWSYVSRPQPTREPIAAAMRLVSADFGYVVLHDYWKNYDRLAEETAAIADGELPSIPHLRIFLFNRSTQPKYGATP
ncbi:MAG: hypothetical protein V1723_03415 [Candidatus Uhrbacteria bacterium]